VKEFIVPLPYLREEHNGCKTF
jgi:hypothetical protein